MNITNKYISKYYKGGVVKFSCPLVEISLETTPNLQKLALSVTIVTVVPTMLLIVTMFLLLQLLPL